MARHPPVTARGLCYGRADVPLACSAEHAAVALQTSFGRPAGSVVWSSPSPRCASVAQGLASRWQADLRLDNRLLELNFGDWEGRAWTTIERDDPARYASWMSEWRTAAPPGGESIEALMERVAAWVVALREGMLGHATNRRPVVVAHAGVVRALLVLCEGVTWDDAMTREVPHLAWRRIALE